MSEKSEDTWRRKKKKKLIWPLSPSHLIRTPAYSIKLLWNWFCCIFGSHSPLLGCNHTSKETHMKNMLVLQAGMPQSQASLTFLARPLGKLHQRSVRATTHQHNLHMTSRIHTPKLNHMETLCKSNTPGPRHGSRSPVPAASNHVLPELPDFLPPKQSHLKV